MNKEIKKQQYIEKYGIVCFLVEGSKSSSTCWSKLK